MGGYNIFWYIYKAKDKYWVSNGVAGVKKEEQKLCNFRNTVFDQNDLVLRSQYPLWTLLFEVDEKWIH